MPGKQPNGVLNVLELFPKANQKNHLYLSPAFERVTCSFLQAPECENLPHF